MRFLDLPEVADLLRTTPDTVSAMIRTEGLPAAKVGRAWVLIDEDVAAWLRFRYKGEKCDSTSARKAAPGMPRSTTAVGQLAAVLARSTAPKRKNGQTPSKPHSGEPTDSDNVLPLHGTPL